LNRTTLKYELDLDFVLVAITAPLKDYRLCFKINKELHMDFSKQADHQILLSNREEACFFSKYFYLQPHSETGFTLLANKGSDGLLVPEMKTVDYFLLIHNYIDNEELKQVIGGLNRVAEVLVAAELDPKKLKSKENLII
jgi:hypothetical protein